MSTAAYDSREDTLTHIARVSELLADCERQLERRAEQHDQSKLEEPEKSAFDVATPKLAHTKVGTPEFEAAKADMGPALQHHYEHNRHHPEHFEDGIWGMNLLDFIEMLCDWKAAGERHDPPHALLDSIDVMQKRYGFGMEFRRLLENTARDMGWA